MCISISFDDDNNQHYTDESITYVYQARNKIFYKKAEKSIAEGYKVVHPRNNKVHIVPAREDINLIPYYDEPYEEAVKKLQDSQKN